MKPRLKKYITIALIFALFTVFTGELVSSDSPKFSAVDQTTEFLSSIVGLDMTKYTLAQPSPPAGYEKTTPNQNITLANPEERDGLKIDGPSFDFQSSEGTLHTFGMFYNEHFSSLKITSHGSYIYSGSPPTDILHQTNNLLDRYRAFISEKYAMDGAFLVSMRNLINSVNDLSPKNLTAGNINFQVSEEGGKTRLQWIYTEEGCIMNYKRVDISFVNNTLVSFRDTWSLFKVSGLSVISAEEATKIALEAAQTVELHIGHADGTNETVKVPDLSNAPVDMYFTMVPYTSSDQNFPSKLPRDPLTLYPLWQFQFLFSNEIGGNNGVQVGVWGDTKEIFYASGYGYLGAVDISTEFSNTTSVQNVTEQEQNQPSTLDTSVLVSFFIIAAVITLSAFAIAKKRKKQNNILFLDV